MVDIKHPIKVVPHFLGSHARAWICNVGAGVRKRGLTAEQTAVLAVWLVEAPWAHPAWHSYSLTLLHLRPMPGVETKTYLVGATHELWLHALDPGKDHNMLVEDGLERQWLVPMNFAAQIIAAHDAEAIMRCAVAVRAICDGRLHPDIDFRAQWIAMFGNNMQRDRTDVSVAKKINAPSTPTAQ